MGSERFEDECGRVMNANQAALTIVNHAIRILDFNSTSVVGQHDEDDAIGDAQDMLLAIRERLTDKPWPELPIGYDEVNEWLSARAAEQKADGRQ